MLPHIPAWLHDRAFDKWLVEIVTGLVNLVGIPIAIFLYFLSRRKERIEREYGTYNTLDEKYIEYLKMCLEHPDLDVFDVPACDYRCTPRDQRKELIIFAILIAVFERAFLMYADKSKKIRTRQWTGWDGYIQEWSKRVNFRRAWDQQRGQYDDRFETYMNNLMADAVKVGTSPPPVTVPATAAARP